MPAMMCAHFPVCFHPVCLYTCPCAHQVQIFLDSGFWSWNYNLVGFAKILTSQKIDISFVTSLSCLVMDVRGNLGFMDGLRLMVPVVGKSHSNATSQHDEGAPPSLIQPLELELEALLRDESLRRNRGPAKKFQYYYKLCCMNNRKQEEL